jgi:hypothetical protein
MKHLAFTQEALAALRREFDEAFQTLPQQEDDTLANYLLLQVSGIRYAVALRQVAALQSQSRITRLPSTHPALLGVCGARSELLAVYDLGICLGHAPSERHPWLARVAGTTLAFAFEHLERHARARAASRDSGRSHVVTLDDVGTLPLLDLHQLARKVAGASQRPPNLHPEEA